MDRREQRFGARQFGLRQGHSRSIEKALIVALYFAFFASGAVAIAAQLLPD